MLKPFLPQLQTTFIKALNDPNREVRMCAAKALQKLIKLHTRVDPLFTELHNGVKNTEDNNIRLERLPDFVLSSASCLIVHFSPGGATDLCLCHSHISLIIRFS